MTTKLNVCKSSSCKSNGAGNLIRDLEELCGESSGYQPTNGSCLDHCGRGPNVQVQSKGVSKVVEGVKTFKDIRNLLEKSGGAKIKKLDYQVGEIRYEARRAKGPDRLAKVEKGFKALGGEEKASKEPHLAASLFALRAEELLRGGGNLEGALQDAQRAYALWKGFAPAHLTAALALFRLGQAEEAREEMRRLEDASFGTSAPEDRRALMKEAEKHPPKEVQKAEEAAPEPTEQPAAPAAEAKAVVPPPKAKAKAKAKAKSEPKAENSSAPTAPTGAGSKPRVKKAKSKEAESAAAPEHPVPAEPPAQGEDCGEAVESTVGALPVGRIQAVMAALEGENSPGGISSTRETAFPLVSEMDEERPQVAATGPHRVLPRGRHWIVSL